jgi:lauroyl/myristoyl acyltransferase
VPLRSRKEEPMHTALRVLKIAVLGLVALVVPPRLWHRAARLISRPLVLSFEDPDAGLYEATLGTAPKSLGRDRLAWRREAQLQILGLAGWWPHSRLEVTLTGEEHLRRALAQGQGAVLWMSGFASAFLLAKLALWRRGFAVHHLSRPEHGFGTEKVDLRLLNPIWRRVENRFLGSRVVIEHGDARPALARLESHLAANEIVKITVGNNAKRVVEVPFLKGTIRLATGPIALARRAGAPLLPLHTVAVAPGRFVAAIEPPLPLDDAGPDPYGAAAAAYAQRLEHWVRSYPAQWTGWGELVPRSPAIAAADPAPTLVPAKDARI